MKIIKILYIAFLSIFFLFIFLYLETSVDFDSKLFLSKNYSREEIVCFCDIGFFYGRIKKWETDIEVEIVNIEKLEKMYINEVDSIINILRPLISPININRVEKNGNLKIYRNLKLEEMSFHMKRAIRDYSGLTVVNPLNINHFKISRNIIYANIYEREYVACDRLLMHEFLHAIGLDHPSKPHDYPMAIASYKAPNIFYSPEESIQFDSIKFYISEQEKQVIRMLYSSGIKSGLKRSQFIKKMNIDY